MPQDRNKAVKTIGATLCVVLDLLAIILICRTAVPYYCETEAPPFLLKEWMTAICFAVIGVIIAIWLAGWNKTKQADGRFEWIVPAAVVFSALTVLFCIVISLMAYVFLPALYSNQIWIRI